MDVMSTHGHRSRSLIRALVSVALFGALGLGIAGCGTAGHYIYEPAERASARVAGERAAYYPVPETSPHGDVRVASFGIAKVGARAGEDATSEIEALHARVVIANNQDDEPWVFDTRAQYAVVGAGRYESPVFVRTAAPDAPVVHVPRGTSTTVDLYFPLPREQTDEDEVPAFDLYWQLGTAQGPIAARTPFERLLVVPRHVATPMTAGVGMGMGMGFGAGGVPGPYGYGFTGVPYDPFWGSPSFPEGPVFVVPAGRPLR